MNVKHIKKIYSALIFILIMSAFLFTGCSTTKTNEVSSPSIENTENVTESQAIASGEELKVQFIDVGQADASLISYGDHYMLIDGGNTADSDIIYTVLSKNNIKTLDAVVATHMHEDHIGGLPAAFQDTKINAFYSNGSTAKSKVYTKLMAAVSNQNLEPIISKQGDSFKLGDAVCTFVNSGKNYSDENDKSLVLKITYGETSFLFTGDASDEAEKDMVNSGIDLTADVLKVGHHGSKTATGYVFLREVMPEFSIISVGTDNKYGHPTEDTLSRLRDEGTALYRTDLNKDITVVSNGQNITVNTSTTSETNPFTLSY